MEQQWLTDLQYFLNDLLSPIIPTDEDRFRYIDGPAMLIWAEAFTHETYSPVNYENLEYLGDAILKAVFPKYLMNRFPKLKNGDFTELNVSYMSKIKQGELSRSMGLSKFIRVGGMDKVIFNVEADVFESFFGALDTVSDRVIRGLGFSNCYNMILHLFRNIDIDPEKINGSAKTQVMQMFSRFDLPQIVEATEGFTVTIQGTRKLEDALGRRVSIQATSSKKKGAEVEAATQLMELLSSTNNIRIRESKTDSDTSEVTVSLRDEHLRFLREYGVNVPNLLIGSGHAPTKKDAESKAYAMALDTLKKYGITKKWAEKVRNTRDFSDPSMQKYIPRAKKRLEKEGFVSMNFMISRKTTTNRGAIVQLQGVKADGEVSILGHENSRDIDLGHSEAKLSLVRRYADGK